MGILIVIGVISAIVIFFAYSQKEKEENAESIAKAADIFRRIGYADKKAITEEWEHLKKFESKWIICEAWQKVFNEFTSQGDKDAIGLLAYYTGDVVMKYLEELREFYQKADGEAHK